MFAAHPLWVARPFAAAHGSPKEIEGPAVDRSGNIYAVWNSGRSFSDPIFSRLATRHDTAFGSPEFLEQLERKYGIPLRAKPPGRPRKPPQAEVWLAAAATVSA